MFSGENTTTYKQNSLIRNIPKNFIYKLCWIKNVVHVNKNVCPMDVQQGPFMINYT
jgi:hypothetical protein